MAVFLSNKLACYAFDWEYLDVITREGAVFHHEWAVRWTPDAILFGTHNKIMSATHMQWVHKWFGLLFIASLIVFATTILPLDEAWRCYANPSMSNVGSGLCTNRTAPTSKFPKQHHHIPSYWDTVGVVSGSFFVVMVAYVYSIYDLPLKYTRRATKQMQKTKLP
jgi:hypothetical protein